MLPYRCSVKQNGKDCVNPPEYVIQVVHDNNSYMVGITCEAHQNTVSTKITELQIEGKVPKGKILFEKLKSVGTVCVRVDSDDWVHPEFINILFHHLNLLLFLVILILHQIFRIYLI